MAFPLFLAFFVLLSPLLLVSSDSEQEGNQIKITCPNSFDCQKFGPLYFPLSNSTQNSRCGLCTVTCHEKNPTIQLGNEGPWYDVVGIISQADDASPVQIQIHDPLLPEQFDQRNCDELGPIMRFPNSSTRFPNSSTISFKTLNHEITLFKCNKSSFVHLEGFHKYTNCSVPFDLYYYDKYREDQPSALAGLKCSEIQLPIPDPSDPFLLVSADFTVELHVSKQCLDCHRRGGQCRDHNQKFDCTAKKGGKMFLILGVAVGIGGFVLLLSCCLARHLALGKSIVFWKNETEDYRNIEAFLKNCGSLSPKRYTYSDIKKMTNSFRIKLGQGGYGCVFKGKLENGSLVAVKVLKGLKGSGEDFVNEVATISRTSHVNIVTLLGFCFEGGNRALIYEFMPNGSLDKFIHDGNTSTYRQLGWDSLYKIAVGIARGLEYLHRGCNTRILHFDIKPHNILLDEDFCPKISDFGLAKLCPQKESIVSLLGARGTAGYIAPEVFCRNFGEVSHKSDVYSYGMMVLEMVGGRKNISVEVDHTSEIYFPHWIYKRLELDEELGLHGIVDEVANGSVRKMVIVGLWCIQTDPSHRPSMGKVVEMLEGSLESLQIPPKPFLSSPSRSPADSSTTIVVT